MKKATVEILNNFASINTGMLFRTGNAVRVLSGARTVFASAVVEETFPREFAIYDLPEFLNTLAMFKEPEISYEDNFILVKGDGTSVKYHYSSPTVVVAAPDMNPAFRGDAVLEFSLSRAALASIEKAANVLRLKDVRFDGESGQAIVFNRDKSGNEFKVDLKDCKGQGAALLSVANMKMLPDDYNVRVDEVAAHFVSPNGGDLTYVVVREQEQP